MIFKLNKKLGLKLLTKGTYIEDDIEVTLNDESYRNLIASNVKEGVKILDVIGTMKNEKPEQEKEVVPSFETQIVLPDSEDYTLGKVTVHPIPDVYIIPEGNIVLEENDKIYNVHNFSTAEVKIPTEILRTELNMTNGDQKINPLYADYLQQVIVQRPEDLQPDNIKVGKNIGGIEGSYLAPEGWLEPEGTLDIFENGEYDVTSKEFVDVQVPLPSGTITITSEGPHDVYDYKNAVVTLPKQTIITDLDMIYGNQVIEPILEGHFLTKAIIEKPEDLQPENIKVGKNIGGIVGTYTAPEGWGEAEGTYLLNKNQLTKIIEDGKQAIYPNEFIDTNIKLIHPVVTLNMMEDGELSNYQPVFPRENELFEYINIQRPKELTPENIKKDVIIAGVEGTYEAPSGWLEPEGTYIIDKNVLLDIIENGPHDVTEKAFVGTNINLERPNVELSLANGNQIIDSSDNGLIKTLEIEKPITLEPDNIKNDVNIAGVVGTYIAPDGWDGPEGTYDLTKDKLKDIINNGPQDVYPNEFIDTSINLENPNIELNLANGNQIVNSSSDGLIESVEIEKPSTLEPKNIRKDINIAGVIGTLQEPEGEIVLDFTDKKDATKTPFDVFNYATATTNFTTSAISNDLLKGKTAYSADGLIVGSIEEYEGDNDDVPVPDTDALREIIERTIEVCNIPSGTAKIGNYAFEDCENLTSVEIPFSVKSIGKYAFYWCSSLTSIVIPNSVTSIGSGAFNHCGSLESVILPNSITKIMEFTFSDCNSLKNIIIPNSVTSIGVSAFESCDDLENITISNSVTSIAKSTFESCESLTNIEIPYGVKSIGESAFQDCSSLTSVEIPSSLESIGKYAFQDCSSLTSVEIPSSLENIEYHAFYGCSSLVNVIFDKTINDLVIGEYAFCKCINLTNLEIYRNVINIKQRAFQECTSLKKIYIEEVSEKLDKSAFLGCTSLEEVHIKDIKEIGDYVFSECTSLKKIIIENPSSSFIIETSLFYNCNSLQVVDFSKSSLIPEIEATFLLKPIPMNNNLQILVPSSLYNEWINTTGWTYYKNYIKAV